MECEVCGKEFTVTKGRIEAEKKRDSKIRYCSKKCQNKGMRKFITVKCPECGKDFDVKASTKRKFCSHSCEMIFRLKYDSTLRKKIIAGVHKSPTRPEREIIEILGAAFPDEFLYNGDFRQGVMLGGLIPDFVNVNGKKKVIEVFGDYWHSDELTKKRWKGTEFGRKAIYAQLGFDCLVLWEREIKNLSSDKISKRIELFVQGG